MLSTRAQILDAALRLFVRQGYQRTSVREIAEQLGLTKTAVLYHFPSKADIFAALAEPFLDDLEAALATTDSAPAVIEGILDTFLAHRQLLRDNVMHDMALLAQSTVIKRFARLMFEANRVVAGPEPDLRRKVRAAQVVSMLSDPVIAHADEPVDRLREEILIGVRLVLPEQG
jgi:AcrR family transcriptional regulator